MAIQHSSAGGWSHRITNLPNLSNNKYVAHLQPQPRAHTGRLNHRFNNNNTLVTSRESCALVVT